eukprot:TRINITY_DN79904_c0_g1_i1.p1 TRINITY_DN79904_c0_g1~~TRINITY_DN79904_c0_g1_i1.p1  ORF type:complete len:493 (+),score=74.22 TRINITY_DN79904_c0_g1_i1:120-1598(+)
MKVLHVIELLCLIAELFADCDVEEAGFVQVRSLVKDFAPCPPTTTTTTTEAESFEVRVEGRAILNFEPPITSEDDIEAVEEVFAATIADAAEVPVKYVTVTATPWNRTVLDLIQAAARESYTYLNMTYSISGSVTSEEQAKDLNESIVESLEDVDLDNSEEFQEAINDQTGKNFSVRADAFQVDDTIIVRVTTTTTTTTTTIRSEGYVFSTLAGQPGLAGQQNWTGGASPGFTNECNQPDQFPYTVTSGDCPDRGDSVINASVGNAFIYAGSQAWQYKRGYTSSGEGTPFSPSLEHAAGKPSSGAPASSFKATFYIRAAQKADNSQMIIVGANPEGTDRSSNWFSIQSVPNYSNSHTNSSSDSMVLTALNFTSGYFTLFPRTTDCSGPTDPCCVNFNPESWLKVSMSLKCKDEGDVWSYMVNDCMLGESEAYFELWREDKGFDYETTSRLKFYGAHANFGIAFQGFVFDNFAIETSNDAGEVLSSYETGFEP